MSRSSLRRLSLLLLGLVCVAGFIWLAAPSQPAITVPIPSLDLQVIQPKRSWLSAAVIGDKDGLKIYMNEETLVFGAHNLQQFSVGAASGMIPSVALGLPEDLLRWWLYCYVGNEQTLINEGKKGRAVFTGSFYLSVRELSASNYDELHDKDFKIQDCRLLYVMVDEVGALDLAGAKALGVIGGSDSDGDGVNDAAEALLGTQTEDPDSDDDGLSDFVEAWTKRGTGYTNAANQDTDGDGIGDGIELGMIGDADPQTTTGPLNTDTDGDGVGDGVEDANRNGKVDPGETDPGDVASKPVCGNGVSQPTETCDDGNTTGADGCSATCAIEPGWTCTRDPSTCATVCGDGLVRGSETCDDKNTTAGDMCSAACVVESGWTCTGDPSTCTATCGDGLLRGSEECDDGNTSDGDGCSATCTLPPIPTLGGQATCGNGTVEGDEACDDGNLVSGDGCSGQDHPGSDGGSPFPPGACHDEGCGDGFHNPDGYALANGSVALPEDCDDGNITGGDGCSSTCTVEGSAPTAWTEHVIGSGKEPSAIAMADVTGDGEIDIIGGLTNGLRWYKNEGLSHLGVWMWGAIVDPYHALGQNFRGLGPAVSLAATGDLNHDGYIDVVVGPKQVRSPPPPENTRFVWYENVRNSGTWLEHPILPAIGEVGDVKIADINGDGSPDIVVSFSDARTNIDSEVGWLENDGASPPAFTLHTFHAGDNAWAVNVADMDNDGHTDVVYSEYNGTTHYMEMIVQENDGQPAPAWTKHVVGRAGAPGMRPYNSVVDLNGDGRTDIVLSGDSNGVALGNGQRTSVAWLENPGSLGQFTSHAIAEPQEGTPVITAAIAIGDLDGDGDSDTAAIIGGRRFDWFENTGGRYPSWKPHTVVAEADNIYFRNLAVGDIESGHADIIVARSTDNMGSVDGHFVLYTRQ